MSPIIIFLERVLSCKNITSTSSRRTRTRRRSIMKVIGMQEEGSEVTEEEGERVEGERRLEGGKRMVKEGGKERKKGVRKSIK